ncbi:MAG: hypothetical protein ACW99U_08705 [Candidatus Thorarchaeota archaeon]
MRLKTFAREAECNAERIERLHPLQTPFILNLGLMIYNDVRTLIDSYYSAYSFF